MPHMPWTRRRSTCVLRFFGRRDCSRRESRVVDKSTGLRSDRTVVLQGPTTAHLYPTPLRRIAFYDDEHQRRLVFLTNNLDLPALTIAQLCRCRWRVERFFQTELADQDVLRPLRQRREDAGVDRHQRLRVGGHPQEGVEDRPQPHRNPPNPGRDSFRENPISQALATFSTLNSERPCCNQLSLFDL
jgi:hypothetical protein